MGINHVPVSLAVIVLYVLIVYASCDDGHGKRILLSDPSYVQQQMTHLQGELQTLQAKTQTLEATVQTQTGELFSLKQQLSHANNETQNQHSEIAALKQQLSQANHAIQNQHSEIVALDLKLAQGDGGATFVRWGRTDCPSNMTELVYSGYAGGSWYYHKGAAADHLCLPRDPEWLQTTVVPDDNTGRIYGSEYESANGHTLFGPQSHNEDVPCAVCRSTSFVSSVMIPARTTCYSGWTKAYGGSLASGWYDYPAASEYVCVDEQAQPLAGGGNTDDNVYVSGDDGHDKRILLSDPSDVQQRMTHLQGDVQTLQATTQTQHAELQTLQAKTQTLESTVQTQTGEISSLNQQLSQANNETQNQHNEITALKQQLSQANQEAKNLHYDIADLNQNLAEAIQNRRSEFADLNQKMAEGAGGATFVRWGRTDCPSNLTELVYSGYVGGSFWSHYGGAVDHLCLPPDPEWLQTSVVPDDNTGRIYGAEYESLNRYTLFGSRSKNTEVPCAVCRSTSFVSSVMIPARTTCYRGWTKAYGGSLAAGHYNHAAASQYVCVDENAQPLPGGGYSDENGKLLYGVKAFCGSLRCPPYQPDKYISCVVCMK